MKAVMTANQYYRNGITGSNPAVPMASRPEPTEVTDGKMTDGRYWGELAGLYPLSAATADEAAKASAVNFCCSVIAEAIGSLPFDVIDIATDKPAEGFELADLLSYAPNPLQVGAEFWPSMMFTAALRNIAYAEPVAHADGLEMWLLDPLRTHTDWRDRSFTVTYQEENANARVLGPGDLFWITGLSDSGSAPLTPWKMARGSIEFALALEHQGRTTSQMPTVRAGVLQSDQELGDEAFERLKESMRMWRAGGNAILEQGLKYEVVQQKNTDSQLMELIDQRTLEMARYWRMPRSMITGNSKNSEQESGDFVRWVARPWCRRIEQAVRARLFTPEMRSRFKVKINLDAMLRGDSATQARNAVLYRTAGSHSINDVRTKIHNLPRIDEPWADDVREPLNSNRAADTMSGGETAPQERTPPPMIEMASARTLWAMHPDALGALLKRGSIDAMLPESLLSLAALAGGGQKEARASADPVRDGATMIVPLSGPLSPRGSYGGTSTERFADQIRSAAADTKIGAIIVHVMSPGGWVFGTQEAGDAVFEARQSKPIIAVASPYSFSAAHWIACQASAYYVTQSGEVGSVGVRGGHVDMSGFEDKIGMKTTLIASSPEKIAAHPHAPLSDEDRAEIQASIDESNQAFAAAIARGRGIKASEVAGIHGSGKTFSAAKAAAAGAVDGVMSLREVVAKYGSSRARLGLMRQRAEMRTRALAI